MAVTAMDSVIFLLTCIRRMWAEKESVICGRHLLLEVWDGILFQGLNLSVGVEPTFLFFMTKSFFDLPVFARLAYDFRFMEVAVQYKWG